MDGTPENIETELKINHLTAERESLKAQLEEYLYIIDMRDREIENLRRRLAGKTAYVSSTDNQERELQTLSDDINKLKLNAAGAVDLEKQLSDAVSMELDLESKQQQYNYFQNQLADMQERVSELTNRNLLLQQDASRMAELESLLEDALRERDELIEQLKSTEAN